MKCVFLGNSNFTSKSGKACYVLYFGKPMSNYGSGYSASTFWVDEVTYNSVMKLNMKPLTPCDCDIRFSNNVEFLRDVTL